ncbi:hypothetical protein sync_2115 [Synechococcus sp. CC9311]|nr:hypothetical protein sync_2115 [Synechococcus sp. CC9311]
MTLNARAVVADTAAARLTGLLRNNIWAEAGR